MRVHGGGVLPFSSEHFIGWICSGCEQWCYRLLYCMGGPGLIRSHSGNEFVPFPEGKNERAKNDGCVIVVLDDLYAGMCGG